ncbi:hypothetical protein PAHAL_8G025600 [Panicum hallii]|uniref:Uncharacterized protein n=1 Tax=Panicum hallii TaxID=206008 RepID=A0A2T8I7C5_9POAL|nr:hypothetical protein PAHAL_8G025600 [Panicum hallii]
MERKRSRRPTRGRRARLNVLFHVDLVSWASGATEPGAPDNCCSLVAAQVRFLPEIEGTKHQACYMFFFFREKKIQQKKNPALHIGGPPAAITY